MIQHQQANKIGQASALLGSGLFDLGLLFGANTDGDLNCFNVRHRLTLSGDLCTMSDIVYRDLEGVKMSNKLTKKSVGGEVSPIGAYVYIYYIKDVPRYVGKGTGARWYDHIRRIKTSRTPWGKALAKAAREGASIRVEIDADNITENQAGERESELIAELGKVIDKTGTLFNVLDGNDGHTHASAKRVHADPVFAKKHRARMQKLAADPEFQERRDSATRAAMAEPGYKERQLAGVQKNLARPEFSKNLSTGIAAGKSTPQAKANASAAAKRNWGSMEYRARHKSAMGRVMATDDYKAKVGAASKAAHARPDVKAKHSASLKLAANTLEGREQRRAAARKAAADPHVFAIRSAKTAANNALRKLVADATGKKYHGISRSQVNVYAAKAANLSTLEAAEMAAEDLLRLLQAAA